MNRFNNRCYRRNYKRSSNNNSSRAFQQQLALIDSHRRLINLILSNVCFRYQLIPLCTFYERSHKTGSTSIERNARADKGLALWTFIPNGYYIVANVSSSSIKRRRTWPNANASNWQGRHSTSNTGNSVLTGAIVIFRKLIFMM